MKNLGGRGREPGLERREAGAGRAFFEVGRIQVRWSAARVSRSNANLALGRPAGPPSGAMTSPKAAMGSPGCLDFSLAEVAEDPGSISPAELPTLDAAVSSASIEPARPGDLQGEPGVAGAVSRPRRVGQRPETGPVGGLRVGFDRFLGAGQLESWADPVLSSFRWRPGGEKIREAGANLEGAEARLESYRQQVLKDA